MTLILQSIGLSALVTLAFYPLAATDWAKEQNAVAVRANAVAQCVGEMAMRKVQRTCKQQEQQQ